MHDYGHMRTLLHNDEMVIKGITREAGGGEAHFIIRSALAKYLGDAADWEQKLLLLVEQAETEPEDLAMTYLDEIIAEVFDGSQALREVLGYQRNLGDALGTLSALSVGQYEKKRKSVPVLERLSAIRSRRPLPLSRIVMLERIESELGGIKPLTGDGKEAEQKAFKRLVGQLVDNYALVGKDNQVSEAATSRAKEGQKSCSPRKALTRAGRRPSTTCSTCCRRRRLNSLTGTSKNSCRLS